MGSLGMIICILAMAWVTSLAQDITYHIDEELPVPSYIGNISKDSNLFATVGGINLGTIIFTFIDNKYIQYFRVDTKTGYLYVNAVIDRETVCEFSEICVLDIQIAGKATLGSFFRILRINVFINDINDNSPVFTKSSLTRTISEAVLVGTYFTIDSATDKDTSQQYSLKSYELKSKDQRYSNDDIPFSIQLEKNLDGSSVVRLIVMAPLDREVRDSYILELVAKDGGIPPRQGTLPVYILLSDVNDNQPQFRVQSYNCTVSDLTAVGKVVTQVYAIDSDLAENGLVRYRFSSLQKAEVFQYFNVNAVTGEISLKAPMVYSPGKMFNIIVEAYDNPLDGQSLPSQELITITMLKSGNNPPQIVINFLTNTNQTEVSEFASIGKVIAYIVVIDYDIGEQGTADCIIHSIDFDMQRIDLNKYKVFVAQPPDYERTQSQNITIYCQDSSNPPLATSASFVVQILDENDNAPVFVEQSYSKNVREDFSVGEVILEVSTTDLDTGLNAKVNFEVSKEYRYVEYFYFANSEKKSNAGPLILNKTLDRERESSFVIPVWAKDLGNPSKTGYVTVTLYITDVNDERPIFTKTIFSFWIKENLPAYSSLGQVMAIDNDLGINGQLEYTLHPDFKNKIPFVVLADGLIKTNSELDREVVNHYEFKVIATDKGEHPQSSTGSCVVTVYDVNDNSPVLLFPRPGNNTVYVSQSSAVQQIIAQVIAADADEINTDNSRVRFDIQKRNDSGLFQMNTKTGEIQTTEKLQSIHTGNIFGLEIFVSDSGVPRECSTTMWLYVNVVSENTTKTEASTIMLSNQNILIAVAVGVVTVALSIAIVTSIFIIRKIDRKNKEDPKKRNNNQITDPDLDSKQVFDGSMAVFSLPSEDSLLQDKKKKEVSFSLEDDVFSDDELIQNNGIDNGQHFKPSCTYLSPVSSHRKVEDNHSETSTDTGTSDSGRGGSDEELPNTRSHSPREKILDFTRPVPPITHQEIIPFSFKKGMSTPYRGYGIRPCIVNCDQNHFEFTRHDLDDTEEHDLEFSRSAQTVMAVHLPNDSFYKCRNTIVLLQTDSGVQSDTNFNDGETIKDSMV